MNCKTYAHLAAAALLLGTSGLLQAQEIQPCGTDEVRQQMIQNNPDLLRQEAEYELGLQEYLEARRGLRDQDDSTVYIIPVVFHVLYDPTAGNDQHNISDAQIIEAVNLMNRDYAKLNPDLNQVCCGFQEIAADVKVRFQLATIDPFGNCTNGIDRITTQRSYKAANFSKLNTWFREHYLNIWVVQSLDNTGGISPAGYSQLPPNVQDEVGSMVDGVILLHDYTGSTGTSNMGRSRTLTHEVGHYLNLMHTWGGTNAPGIACGDDGVDDTPMTKGHATCTEDDLHDSFCSSQPFAGTYTFDDVTTTSGQTDPTPAPTALTDSLSQVALVLSAVHATGVSDHSHEAGSFSFSDWATGATDGDTAFSDLTGQINTSKYYAFTIAPEVGKSYSIKGIGFKAARSESGPRTFAVRTSVNNYATNLSANVQPTDTNDIAVESSNTFFFRKDTAIGPIRVTAKTPTTSQYQNRYNPITFRIYAWNAEDQEGLFTIDDLDIDMEYGFIENTENYMEYSYCSKMFTLGQAQRMRATLNSDVSGRSTLWTDDNHRLTGIAGYETPCSPKAGFYTTTPFVCAGTPVTFKDNSTNATPTTWAWTFEGGTPETSNLRNPTVTFNEPGPHRVTLTVMNDEGSSTHTQWDAVYIGANYSEVGAVLQEGFDNEAAFDRWPQQNFEHNQSFWQWDGAIGHNAPGCAKLNASETYTMTQDFFQPNNFQDIDNLITPSLYLGFHNDITVRFWYAYSTQTGETEEITEALKVYASGDCGKTWLLRKTINGGDLVTAGIRSPGYAPQPNEWRQASLTLPGLFAGSGVRLKFEFSTGRFSNNLYIDDIELDAANVGVDELALTGDLDLMPNPASNSLTVRVDLAGATDATLSFLDVTGRVISTQAVKAGLTEHHFNLERMGLNSGVYLVRLEHAKGQRVKRLVVR